MKKVYTLAVLMGLASLLFSCQDKLQPNYQLFPNMYESAGYETYSESKAFNNGKEGLWHWALPEKRMLLKNHDS